MTARVRDVPAVRGPGPRTTRARVLVVCDAALTDPTENRAGPVVEEALREVGCQTSCRVVPSAPGVLRRELAEAVAQADVVVTCGGQGVRPGDCVVELTRELGLVELPGIGEEIRRRGADATPAALLSRGLAGVVGGDTVVVNAPSSRGGARDVAAVLTAVLPHLLRDLTGAARV